MSDEPKRPKPGAVVVITMAILLPILYILSVGPVILIVDVTDTEQELEPVLEVFYFPVIWLHEKTPLRGPLNWYVELWVNP